MNCQEARLHIEDALDKSLSGGVKRRLDLHLQHCAECRAFFEAEKAEFVRWYAAVNNAGEHAHSLPSDFADRLVAAVTAPRPMPFFLRMPRWALVAASFAVMAMGTLFAAVVVEKVISSFAETSADAEEPAAAPVESETPQSAPFNFTTGNAYALQSPYAEYTQSESGEIADVISTNTHTTQTDAESASEIENKEGNGNMNMMKKGSAVLATAAMLGATPMASGVTYYKIGTDEADTSSFTTNVSATVGWATSADATETTPFSATEMAAADFVVPSGLLLRSPSSGSSWTFPGKSLRLEGDGATTSRFMFKAANNAVFVFDDLIVAGGLIANGMGDSSFTYAYTLSGKITIESGSSLWLNAADSYVRQINLNSAIYGDDATMIVMSDRQQTGTGVFHFKDLENFFGVLYDEAKAPDGGSTKIYIDGAFGGSVGVLSSKASLVVNYGGLPDGKGLVVSTNEISSSLKTKLTFYSAETDFAQNRLPLVTFPAGTEVDPTEFTLKYATSADGAATVFPNLTVVTNLDDTVTLAVDATVPMYAKMVKGENDEYSWRFYNTYWADVTATCGLTAPTAAIKVYVSSTEEVAPILANPGTPAGYRIGNLSADADLTSLSPLVIETGSEIDLNGHALTVSGSVVDALKASTKDLVVNGNFEAKSLSNGAYDTSAISGWSKSGTVALIKNNNSYAYKQSSSGSGDKQNTTVMCYIAKNGYITQTINVPEQVLCTLSLNKTNKNYYNGGKKYNDSNGSVQIDGSSKTSLASNAGNQGSISTKFELAAGSHTLKIACTSGTGFSVDNVKLTCTPSTGRITSSVEGGELHVNVPSGSTVTNSAINLDGHVKFVKEGAGTFVSKRTELFYDGGNEVVEGRLMTPEGSGSNRDWSAVYRPLGQTGKTITVRKDGTLDIAGNYEYGNYSIVLDGGLLRSGKVIDTGPINQTTNTSWNGIGKLSLTTNSTFYLRGDTLFSGWDDTPINLNGHELLFQMPVDSKNVWMAKDMTNGTIRLTPANAGKRKFAIFKRNVDARTVDVIDEAGCISPLTTFSVRSYTSTAPAGNDYWNGTANMYVYGTFTPATDYFYGCTMMGGSTIDLSGKSGTWSTTGAYNCGRRTVDFADGATIYVKLGDRRGLSSRTPVIGWTTRPSNLDGITFKCAESNITMIKRDDGVYVYPGIVVIIR